ncbi:MAG: hypothetical protein QM706_12130 [Nitrospira sp.]
MNKTLDLFLLKLGLLSFWWLWFGIVLLTNLCEALKVFDRLPWTWKFASHNFPPVVLALTEYAAPSWLCRVFFGGILLWQFITVLLFGGATVLSVEQGSLHWEGVDAAFAAGLGFWAVFMLADEICKQYDQEHNHILFFMAQLVTLVALHLLPA